MKKPLMLSIMMAVLLINATFVIQTHAVGMWIEGRVVGVTDGDTMTMLDSQNQQHEIRLSNIDAPETSCHLRRPTTIDEQCVEHGQAFGKAAKKSLSEMIFGKVVKVKLQKDKSYNRDIGTIYINNIDINSEQITHGFAWHYKKYASRNQSVEDFEKYSRSEIIAREHHLGLWAENNPIEPWKYRH